MSSGQRIGVLVATVLALGVAFVVLNPSGDAGDSDDPPTTVAGPPPAAPAPTTTATTPAQPRAEPRPARPAYTPVRVRARKPVGGVKTIRAKQGDRVRIEVSSPDTTDEVHVHGYDLTKALTAGGRVRFVFTASAEGIFEIELEGAHAQIAQLEVRPG